MRNVTDGPTGELSGQESHIERSIHFNNPIPQMEVEGNDSMNMFLKEDECLVNEMKLRESVLWNRKFGGSKILFRGVAQLTPHFIDSKHVFSIDGRQPCNCNRGEIRTTADFQNKIRPGNAISSKLQNTRLNSASLSSVGRLTRPVPESIKANWNGSSGLRRLYFATLETEPGRAIAGDGDGGVKSLAD